MSVNCFVGRGSLLVSLLGTSGGFFTLSGESEITLEIEEDNESVNDARNGVVERVDWFVRAYRARVLADCFRVEKDAIALLLKAGYQEVEASEDEDEWELPDGIVVGRHYFLAPNLIPASVVVLDADDTEVDDTKFDVDGPYGLITFLDVAGYTQPFTASGIQTGHQSYLLNGANQVFVEAIVKGVNVQTNQKILAHFYRLTLDVANEFKFVQKSFSSMKIQMQATPDLSQPSDNNLRQYGRIMLL